jgi:hypothetical protein
MIWNHFGGDPHPVAVVLAAVAGASAAMAIQRYVIIASTAFFGAWTLLFGALSLTEYGKRFAGRPEVWVVYLLDPSPNRWAVVSAAIVLAFIGVWVQLRYTGRKTTSKPSMPRKSRFRRKTVNAANAT